MKIAVEFDGTIVEDNYPGIGKEIKYSSFILNLLIERGHELILYTNRRGEELAAAVNWCMEHDVYFNAINPVPAKIGHAKLNADIFIDAKNLGGMYSWTEIYAMIHPEEKQFIKFKLRPKKSIFRIFKTLFLS